jgi:hypothetical protein
MKGFLAVSLAIVCLGCALFRPGGRYAARDKNCIVKMLARAPTAPIDNLGIITVDCWTGNNEECEQEVLDEACHRGGDVVWGLGSTEPSTTRIAVHVARTLPPPTDASVADVARAK